MTTPKSVQRNLLLARFARPDIDWVVMPDGKVVGNPFRGEDVSFDINNRLDQKAVIAKLNMSGWNIKPFTRSGVEMWRAEKRGPGSIESFECPTLEEVLVIAVRKVG